MTNRNALTSNRRSDAGLAPLCLTMVEQIRSCVHASFKGVPIDSALKATALKTLSFLVAPQHSCEQHTAYRPNSRLTSTGFPAEFSFGSLAQEIRFTADVGGTTPCPGRRLGIATQRLHDMGHIFDPVLLDWCASLQRSQPMDYGTRINVRIREEDLSCKLLIEVPKPSQRSAAQRFDAPGKVKAHLAQRGARLRMLGLAEDHELEFHFDLNKMPLSELGIISKGLGMARAGHTLLQTMKTLCGPFSSRAFKSHSNRLALKRGMTGDWTMTLYCPTQDLFASGAQTRATLLKAASDLNWAPEQYEAFSRIAQYELVEDRHSMLAFGTTASGEVDLQVALSPATPHEATLQGLLPDDAFARGQTMLWDPRPMSMAAQDATSAWHTLL